MTLPIAESLLIEENLATCLACTKILKDPTNSCSKCNLNFHENCMNNISNTCYNCIGFDDQRYIDDDLDTQSNNKSNDILTSHKASSITTNDQTYVKSHYIDLTPCSIFGVFIQNSFFDFQLLLFFP
jgi:hypothetical protein